MIGTIVNVIAIILGGSLGLLLKGGIKERYSTIITQAQGIAVVFVGLSGAITNMQQEGAKIKVGNMLPAVVVPVIYYGVMSFI